jgi:hypothetical protein
MRKIKTYIGPFVCGCYAQTCIGYHAQVAARENKPDVRAVQSVTPVSLTPLDAESLLAHRRVRLGRFVVLPAATSK